jgi:hypothetical protein
MLIIILASSIGGVAVISFGMMSASGWETPGVYAGTSDASRAPSSTTNCYSFQTGCMNTNSAIPSADLNNGAYLSGNYP